MSTPNPILFDNLHNLVKHLGNDQGRFAIEYHLPNYETTDVQIYRDDEGVDFDTLFERELNPEPVLDRRTFSTAPFDEIMSSIKFGIVVDHHDEYPISESLFLQLQQIVPLKLPTNKYELPEQRDPVQSKYVDLSKLIAFARAAKVDPFLGS